MKKFSSGQRLRLSAALVSLLALVAAACGSTLDPETQEQLSQAGGTFATGGTATGTLPPGAHVNKKGQVVNAKGEVIGSVGGSESALASSSSGPADSETTAAAPGTTYTEGGNEFGPGVTETHILVGMAENNDSRAGCEAIGTCGLMANQPGMEEAFVDWYNKHGGIAGRKIKLVKYRFSTAEASQPDFNQKLCTYFTQDHPVFAFIGMGDKNINRCANRGGVSLISTQRVALSSESFYSNPYVYLVGGATLTTGGVVQGSGLLESGYFDDPSPRKVGLITYDNADHISAAKEGLEKTLAAGGGQYRCSGEHLCRANNRWVPHPVRGGDPERSSAVQD